MRKHIVRKSELLEACTEFLSPKGNRTVLLLHTDPRKELLLSCKISAFQDETIVGDRICFVVRIQGKPEFETKSITEALEKYNSV